LNQFDFGTIKQHGGYIAFYRKVHRSENFVLRDGKLERLFATEAEAYKEAGEAFKAYLNSPISGCIEAREAAAISADVFFNLRPSIKTKGGKRVPVQRRTGRR
jgi:hypothetical protein